MDMKEDLLGGSPRAGSVSSSANTRLTINISSDAARIEQNMLLPSQAVFHLLFVAVHVLSGAVDMGIFQ